MPKAEDRFRKLAESLGWEATKRGWPDFLAWSGNEAIAVEVKPRGYPLRRSQYRTLVFLASKGIQCFVSDGETLVPFSEDGNWQVDEDDWDRELFDTHERVKRQGGLPLSHGKLRRGS